MGSKDGSIIADIITTHMARNDPAAPGQVCPHIGIHAIATVQPPGIGNPRIAGVAAHRTMVHAVQPANSSAETARKPRSDVWVDTI